MMNRKRFIQLSVLFPALSAFIKSCTTGKKIPGKIVGPNVKAGHLLRGKIDHSETVAEEVDIIIIGGGISGLSAARKLNMSGITDFALLELESFTGGNSSYGKNGISSFPLGAHYVPVPDPSLTEYIQFLEDAGVIDNINEEGIPAYNEFYLCADPEERLYINGKWQEGLIPDYGVPPAEKKQISRFLEEMNEFRYAKGGDGKEAFAIPVNNSSADERFKVMDTLTMKEWLIKNDYTSNYLYEYVNYCTRDDFGTEYHQVSAWAGIHYFASRKGKAVNAVYSDVLTWPEGNGFLVKQLSKDIQSNIRTGIIVTGVEQQISSVLIKCLDIVNNRQLSFKTKQCIIAVPQFIGARLLNDADRQKMVRQHFSYAPWMVANLVVGQLQERSGAPASWDNVIAGSNSLGYVSATHQLLNQRLNKRNLTYYLPLTEHSPDEERKAALQRSHEEWAEIVVNDLVKIHPDIRSATEEINVCIWAHAMIQPRPGFVFGDERSELGRSVENNIHFAHTDLAGISIFEEGFYQGIAAADKVIKQLKSRV